MKCRISVTVDDNLIRQIEEHLKGFKSRSAFIEAAVQRFIAHLEHKDAEERDIQTINRFADKLNAEAEDVLKDQEALGDE